MSIAKHFAATGVLPLAWARAKILKNFGDELSYFLNKKLIGPNHEVEHRNFDEKKPRLVSIGTILHEFINGKLWVWGTGMDRALFDRRKFATTKPKVLAVRGNLSMEVLENAGFIKDECMVGDPGILVSKFIPPAPEKKYELGIIPHLSNYADNTLDEYVFDCFRHKYPDSVNIISPLIAPENSIEEKITEITSCKRLVSSSVHGVIVADSYQIPNLYLHEDYSFGTGLHYNNPMEVLEHRIDDYYSVYDLDAKPYYNQHRTEKFDIDAIVEAVDTAYVEKETEIFCTGLLNCHPFAGRF